jgi:hypothetical protein
MQRTLVVCLAAAMWLAGSAAVAAVTDTVEPVGTQVFSVRPQHAGETTLSQGHFDYDIAAGASVTDGIVVTNKRDVPLAVRIYGADMIAAEGGALAPAQRSAPKQQTGAWLRISRDELTLAPHASETVPFELTVPNGIPARSYPGAVVVSTVTGTADGGFNVETRAALMVDLRVQGDLRPAGAVTLDARRDGNEVRFDVPVRNTGNVLYTVEGRVDIYRGHTRVATVPLGPSDIYVIPGGTAELRAVWEQPALGRLRAVATVRAVVDGHGPLELVSRPATLTIVPWRLAASTTVAAAALIGVWRLTRTRRVRRRAERRAARQIVRDLRAHQPIQQTKEKAHA